MTEERIVELEKLCGTGTPETWFFDSYNTVFAGTAQEGSMKTVFTIPDHPQDGEFPNGSPEKSEWYRESAANADFSVEARTALPECLAEIRRLRKEIVTLKKSEEYWP